MTFKKITFICFIIFIIIGALFLSQGILYPFIFAFFLAYALNPLVEFLQKKGARRDWAILTVYAAVLIAGAMVLELIIPRLLRDLTALVQKLPVIFNDFQNIETRLNRFFDGLHLPINPKFLTGEMTKRGEIFIKGLLVQLGNGTIKLFTKSLLYALIPLIAYYISRDYPQIKQTILQWTLKHLGDHWTRTFLKIDAVFKYYIRSQLLDILIVGSMFAVGLSVLGFEASILLGFVAGVFNVIPYFGPVLGALPLIIFALLKSPWYALYVVFLFLAVNQLEVMFLAPRLISSNLNMHPVTVIYLILMGGEIFGLAGMILAVPTGAILIILFKSIYEICFGEADSGSVTEK